MTHKFILKVKTFQLSSAKRDGTVEENPPEGGFQPPPKYHLGLGQGTLTRNLHFYDLHTSSHKVMYFFSYIYKWTLTLLTLESSLAVIVM